VKALCRQGRASEALEVADQARTHHPTAEAWVSRVFALEFLKELALAREAQQHAEQLDPNNPWVKWLQQTKRRRP